MMNADMPITNDLRIGQLLCSRLCHDLCGPANAVQAGLEFIGTAGLDPETVALLNDGGRDLIRRLKFYRLAFGLRGGDAGTATLSEARLVATDLAAGKRTQVAWRAAGVDPRLARPAAAVRCLLGLFLLGIEAIPRGGTIRVRIYADGSELAFDVEAQGPGASIEPGVLAAVALALDAEEITTRTVHAHLAGRLAAALGSTVEVDTAAANRVGLTVRRVIAAVA